MKVINLTIETPYFDGILLGEKVFEARKADRDYNIGDVLHYRELNGQRWVDVHITYILYVEDGWVLLSIERIM